MKKIGFATCAEYSRLTQDEQLVLPELEKLGIKAEPFIWDQEDLSQTNFDAIAIRSCWDFYDKSQEYREWLRTLEHAPVPIFNPPKVLQWNLDKSYLRELASNGIAIPKTVWLNQKDKVNLRELLETHGLKEVVVKPMVSLLGLDTWRTSLQTADTDQNQFQNLLDRKAVMVQEFVPEVIAEGELSFVFFLGEYSHCVRKIPRSGEFRIQEEHGGTRRVFEPSSELIREARKALDVLPKNSQDPLLYARVDGIPAKGRLMIMEVELIDPMLFMKYDEKSPLRFAEAIKNVL
jgi:glutathione synthase/RimK-type ligase-like ATP-grasp enzyme